jgi:hypothetical protein
MPNKKLLFCGIFALGGFGAEGQTITELHKPIPLNNHPGVYQFSVLTDGKLPTSFKASDFEFIAAPKGVPQVVISGSNVTIDGAASGAYDFNVNTGALGAIDPTTVSWTVVYTGLPTMPSATWTGADRKTHLTDAKGKDDASLYFFGSALFGVSTKPLYVIDAKADIRFEVGQPSWYIGGKGTFEGNQDADTPVSESRVDPDSVTASLTLNHSFVPHGSPGSFKHRLSQVAIEIDPVGGEFSRKYPASDIVSTGSIRWTSFVTRIGPADKRTWFALYPQLGYEVGKNLNQPHTLFKQPVELSGWNTIARFAPEAVAELYVFKSKVTDTDLYRFSFDGTYESRILFAEEPFVTTVLVGTDIVKTTTLLKGTRHEVETTANLNLTRLFSFSVKYEFGSLPPLFQFVDHQVTFGFTFKGTLQ